MADRVRRRCLLLLSLVSERNDTPTTVLVVLMDQNGARKKAPVVNFVKVWPTIQQVDHRRRHVGRDEMPTDPVGLCFVANIPSIVCRSSATL